MSTNPGSVVGTNAAYGGRTSVKAFNDALAMLGGRGILSGWECTPVTGMTVQLGGDGVVRDVAIAENATGDRTTINNRSEMPIELTLEEAPETGSRIDAIVAYVVDPPIGTATYVDNPDAVGLIVVSSLAATTPAKPDESAIRTAITLDGASGESAYYVILAYITVAEGATNITASDIEAGSGAAKEIAIDNEMSLASTNPVENRAITSAMQGDTETYSIATSSWNERSNIEPFAYSANLTADHPITANTIAELYNDNATAFAKYGFAIGAISNQTVTIYALKLPDAAVSITINYREEAR